MSAPTVPDGRDIPVGTLRVLVEVVGREPFCAGEIVNDTVDSVGLLDLLHEIRHDVDEVLAEALTASAVPDGEDVPARLDVAADALETVDWLGPATALRRVARVLRRDAAADGRAAVSAAWARPTGAGS